MEPVGTAQASSSSTSPEAATGVNNNGKGKGTAPSDVQCKWFKSSSGCRHGCACRFSHSWEGITDKANRCWLCGSTEHKKSECRTNKLNTPNKSKTGEASASGGGTLPSKSKSSTGGASGSGKPVVNELAVKAGDASSAAADKPSVGGASEDSKEGDAGGNVKPDATAALLHEATQLLKSMRGSQLAQLDQAQRDWILLDSGAGEGEHSEWVSYDST